MTQHHANYKCYLLLLLCLLAMKQSKALSTYTILDQNSECNENTVCMTVVNDAEILDVIGFDLTVKYDALKFIPTGNIEFLDGLPNNDFVSFSYNIQEPIGSQGTMFVSLFFEQGAPSDYFWSAAANTTLYCIEFAKLQELAPNDIAQFNLDQVIESFSFGFEVEGLNTPGNHISSANSVFNGALNYWLGLEPIQFNPNIPNQYSPTLVIGVNESCNTTSATTSLPDLLGSFVISSQNSDHLKFFKDIENDQSVLSVINGYDAILALQVTLNQPSPIPNVFQLMAMDVNRDGAVTAGDVSQINLRTVLEIGEFSQTDGQNLDWIFIDKSTTENDPRFSISTNYPSSDQIGYSKLNVPVLAQCIPFPEQEGCDFPFENYIGILLGDVDGSWKDIETDGELKFHDNTFNLEFQTIQTARNQYSIEIVNPVEDIQSIDFEFQVNKGIKVKNIINTSSNFSEWSLTNNSFKASFGALDGFDEINLPKILIEGDLKMIKKSFQKGLFVINGKKTKIIFREEFTLDAQ